MNNDFALSLKATLLDFIAPLRESALDPRLLEPWLSSLGYVPAIASDPALAQVMGQAEAIGRSLEALDDASLDSWDAVVTLLDLGRNVRTIRASLEQFAADASRSSLANGLARDVTDSLLATWLRRKHPRAFRAGALLGVVNSRETTLPEPMVVTNDEPQRLQRSVDRFDFDALSGLIASPGATLAQRYLPNGLAQAADTALAKQTLFSELGLLADELGLAWRSESRRVVPLPAGGDMLESPPEDSDLPDQGDGTEAVAPEPPLPTTDYYAASFPVFSMRLAGAGDAAVSLELRASSAEHPGALAGYLLVPVGNFQATQTNGDWTVTLAAQGAVPALAITKDGVDIAAGSSAVPGGFATMKLRRQSAPAAPFIAGNPAGTRLELGALEFDAGMSFDTGRKALSFSVGTSRSALIIAPSDGDSFLGQVLPRDGLRAEFDLGLAWSSDTGLRLRGGVALDLTIPVSLSIAGVSLSSVYLQLRANTDQVNMEISSSLLAEIGPVHAVLDRVGLQAAVTFPAGGGNLGPADLSVGFKGPSGVGVTVDAHGVVSGGGFLFHDDAQGLYAGALQLSLHEQLTLKAYGLIATRMPDGSPGYSLLIFITAEDFKPIQLGLGFTLLGIGGMVAINRTFDVNVLRQGLQNDTLATLLFPRDPVGNAPALIQALASAFPARRGSYLLGLLAKIGWFTPTLVLFDLALILEFGGRTRLLALGRISARLPSADNDLVRLNLDALGTIDFDAETISIDATLVDSRLVQKFVISGAGALRAGFGSGPDSTFVLSMGGLHPHFAPPAAFPELKRLTMSLCKGTNPRIVCESYFAITANTLQFGARASLYAAAAGFSVEGDIGYDVLIQLAPLHFIADFDARLQLKRGSSCLFMVEVAGQLEGPRPLRLSGKATFKIWFVHFSVRFDATLIDGDLPPPPPAIDVFAMLSSALLAPENWSTRAVNDAAHGVALRALPTTSGADLVVDPLGQLTIKQQVAPLNTAADLDLFGGAPISGFKRFNLSASSANTSLDQSAVNAPFAPAQYFNMSDDEKLAAPSFEMMQAGCVFGSAALQFDDRSASLQNAPLDYQTIVVGEPAAAAPAAKLIAADAVPYTMSPQQLKSFSRSGSVARAALRRVSRARFRNAAAADAPPPAAINAKRWSIIPRATGVAAALAPEVRTWSEYHAALKSLNRDAARWQLVPEFETEL